MLSRRVAPGRRCGLPHLSWHRGRAADSISSQPAPGEGDPPLSRPGTAWLGRPSCLGLPGQVCFPTCVAPTGAGSGLTPEPGYAAVAVGGLRDPTPATRALSRAPWAQPTA